MGRHSGAFQIMGELNGSWFMTTKIFFPVSKL
jgi:hypothetical protein